MRQSLIISGSLHVLLIIAASMVWPHIIHNAPIEPTMSVELVTIAKETAAPNVAKPEEKPTIKEEDVKPVEINKVPPPPTLVTRPVVKMDQNLPAPPKPAPMMPEPAPTPKLDLKPVPKIDTKFAPMPNLPEPKERAKQKPEKPKENFDISKIAKDLNLDKKADAKPQQQPQPQPAQPQAAPTFGAKLTSSERDALRGMIGKNWNVPTGAPHPEKLVVIVHFYLNPDGSLAGSPEILNPGNYTSDPFFRAAADAALRAVQMTAPFKFLPPDKYSDWREVQLTFDPREMK